VHLRNWECWDATDWFLNRRLTESDAVFSGEFLGVLPLAARVRNRPPEKCGNVRIVHIMALSRGDTVAIQG
jgi:hypothetical protein